MAPTCLSNAELTSSPLVPPTLGGATLRTHNSAAADTLKENTAAVLEVPAGRTGEQTIGPYCRKDSAECEELPFQTPDNSETEAEGHLTGTSCSLLLPSATSPVES